MDHQGDSEGYVLSHNSMVSIKTKIQINEYICCMHIISGDKEYNALTF